MVYKTKKSLQCHQTLLLAEGGIWERDYGRYRAVSWDLNRISQVTTIISHVIINISESIHVTCCIYAACHMNAF